MEIRSIENGSLDQIVPAQNLRILNEDPVAPDCVMDGDMQMIFRLIRGTEI